MGLAKVGFLLLVSADEDDLLSPPNGGSALFEGLNLSRSLPDCGEGGDEECGEVPTEEFVVTDVLLDLVEDVSEAWLEFDDIEDTFLILRASSNRKAVKVCTFVVARRIGADIFGRSTRWTEKLLSIYGISALASLPETACWKRFA